MRRAGDEYRTKLKERVERKQEQADEKREARLGNLQDRIRKHVRHHPGVAFRLQQLRPRTVVLGLQQLSSDAKSNRRPYIYMYFVSENGFIFPRKRLGEDLTAATKSVMPTS